MIVEATTGKVSSYLEVTKYQGKYQLNSLNVNYSYGSLHTIFERLFIKIKIDQYDFSNILILGMGAGSVISLLRKTHNIKVPITAIENDSVVIELSKKYFDIGKYSNLEIINSDAFDFVSNTQNQYDLIIIDLFIDNEVPMIFSGDEFLQGIKKITTNNSCIIYNKMTELPLHKKEMVELYRNFESIFPGTTLMKFNINNMENSILLYNTLPINISNKVSVEQKRQEENYDGLFQPSFS